MTVMWPIFSEFSSDTLKRKASNEAPCRGRSPCPPQKTHLAPEPHLLLLDARCFLQGWGYLGSQQQRAAPCPRQHFAQGNRTEGSWAESRSPLLQSGCGKRLRGAARALLPPPRPRPRPSQHPGPRRLRGAAARSASRGGGGEGKGGGGSSEDGGGGGESRLLRLLFFRARLGCQLFLCFLRRFYSHGQQQQRGAAGGRRWGRWAEPLVSARPAPRTRAHWPPPSERLGPLRGARGRGLDNPAASAGAQPLSVIELGGHLPLAVAAPALPPPLMP